MTIGSDIHGAIEFDWSHDNNGLWRAGLILDYMVGRSYDTFGSLFGVRNSQGFEPIAPDRGIPNPCSDYVQENKWGHSHSYLTYADVEAVEWDQKAQHFDDRISTYNENGEWRGKARYSSSWDFSEEEEKTLNQGGRVWRDAKDEGIPSFTDSQGERIYFKRQRQTRREALSESWEWVLFEAMDQIAEWNGSEQTRLVAWFDS